MREPDHTNTDSGSTDRLEVLRLRAEVTKLNEKLRRKNIALDAMAWVWCDGGCTGGVYRRVDMELTDEVVQAAERNTARLRRWMNCRVFRSKWSAMSADDRLMWLEENTMAANAGDNRAAEGGRG